MNFRIGQKVRATRTLGRRDIQQGRIYTVAGLTPSKHYVGVEEVRDGSKDFGRAVFVSLTDDNWTDETVEYYLGTFGRVSTYPWEYSCRWKVQKGTFVASVGWSPTRLWYVSVPTFRMATDEDAVLHPVLVREEGFESLAGAMVWAVQRWRRYTDVSDPRSYA
jgi:hypothetical protein